jgi:orotidine-5'-phosphate decarboxylase
MNNSPIVVALDVETSAEARKLVSSLGDAVSFYKVGLELYTAAGMDFVRELKGLGHRVFLDLKLYDIGETVKRAVAQVSRASVDFLTVHASFAVMQAADRGREDSGLRLLAVTVLTSVDEADLRRDGYSRGVAELVDLRVKNALEARMDGMVCSALEVSRVRATTGPHAVLVTPGVRSAGAAAGDQKRVATPAEAIAAGADYLVIGRQVTRAREPRREVLRILEELQPAQATR